ncbi:hypothetical protein HN827_02245 [archaeon]|nr:hypothetical protein [archaeon]
MKKIKLSKKHKKNINKFLFIILILISIEISLRVIGDIYLNKTAFRKNDFYLQDNAINILTLGESSTAGLGVLRNESYPLQLERKLKELHPDKNINVIIPVHMGQNTGQLSNRIEKYIEIYKPKIILIMAGYNNEWSLAESNLHKFIKGKDSFKVKLYSFLDNLRLYRYLRNIHIRYFVKNNKQYSQSLKNNQYIWGGPEHVRYPIKKWIYDLSETHRDEFINTWKYDILKIIETSKNNKIIPILMTYHINPTYLNSKEFVDLAKKEKILLIRNDLIFKKIINDDTINQYIFSTDNWHPNSKGYELIAQNIINEINNNKII